MNEWLFKITTFLIIYVLPYGTKFLQIDNLFFTFAGTNFQKFGFQILLFGTIFADLRQVSEKNISHSAPIHTKN